MSTVSMDETTPGEDALEGATAIAEFLFGCPGKAKRVYRAAEAGQIPVFKMGNRLFARKSTLRGWIEQQERRARW